VSLSWAPTGNLRPVARHGGPMGRLTAIVCASVAVLAACAGRRVEVAGSAEDDPATAVLGAYPRVIPGEEATYVLHVLEVPIGRLAMQVGAVEDRDGQPVAWVSTVIETTGVLELIVTLRDEVSTLLDLSTGRPIATRGTFVELLTGRPDPDAWVEAPWDKPEGQHNGHTLILALRGWDPPPGTRAVTTLLSRTNSNQVELHFVGRELLATELGTWPVVRVDGTILGASSEREPFHFKLWMADDTSRAVLRLDSDTDIGLVASARITDYATPAEP
jgi:hypothetical protein